MGDKLYKNIMKTLKRISDPDSGKSIVSQKMVASVHVTEEKEVVILIEVDPTKGAQLETLRQEVEREVLAAHDVRKVTAVLTANRQAQKGEQRAPSPEQPMPKAASADPHGMAKNPPLNLPVKNVIVVASGKGGVGKSTVAANLAVGLAQLLQGQADQSGASGEAPRVGLLDADIYGPSQPLMMGDEAFKPDLNADKKLVPMVRHGLKIMSIGFMTDKEKALVWRGPMVQSAFYQMLRDVEWGSADKPLDYLVIDLPPGTGDVQLTLAQKVVVDGAVIVTTPQDIALIDARRAVSMFEKTGVPVLGLIENMSTHICSQCGHEEHIFGHGGGQDEAERLGIPFLGALPLARDIRFHSDEGVPITLAEPESEGARSFLKIAKKLLEVGRA